MMAINDNVPRTDNGNGRNHSNGAASVATPGLLTKPYVVMVSARFIILSFISCTLLAFSIGRAARLIIIEGTHEALLAPHDESSMMIRPDYHEGPMGHGHHKRRKALPPPILMEGKEVPKTVYTSKNFDTGASASSSSLLIERTGGGSVERKVTDERGQPKEDKTQSAPEKCDREDLTCSRFNATKEKGEEQGLEEEQHLPAGQHLLIDIKDVDGEFLNSEERLAQALVDVISESRLTLLSYHCHTLVPTGVSCVGVLLESHISFHTWPDEGVITLDLFTCGSRPILPVMPIIEKLFGVPRIPKAGGGEGEDWQKPSMIWSHKLRGFRSEADQQKMLASDLTFFLTLMDLDLKKEVAAVDTKYQRIQIYDVIEPRYRSIAAYHRSLTNDGSYESLHPELFQPDRRVFLDGVLQSTLYGDEPYHEALVHPAMFAHGNPKRAAIIGGGEGATLREVLKHNTIEKAVMVEIDEDMVEASRQHLPSWSDCSDLVGSSDWCVEDPRADVYYEDAFDWFTDRFYDEDDEHNGEDEEVDNLDPFDIIIMDALDPQDNVPFAEALYNNNLFVRALYNALTDDGIIVMQLGESPSIIDPPDEMTRDRNRAKITDFLTGAGFQSIHVYEEGHSGFMYPWSYLVAFKEYDTRMKWYKNQAEIEVAIHERLLRTHSGRSPLKYFDGATMESFQIPPRAFETVYCRKEPKPEDCESFEEYMNGRVEPALSFEVRKSGVSDSAGRGLFAKVVIPEGTRIGAEQSVHFVQFPPFTFKVIQDLYREVDEASDLKRIFTYMHGYGFVNQYLGGHQICVDSSILTFVNHGCNGTYNLGEERDTLTEFTVDLETMPPGMLNRKGSAFSPVEDRHLRHMMGGGDWTLRDISAGEEILNNYLLFMGSEEEWGGDIKDLRDQCSGAGVGTVTAHEQVE